MVAPLPPLAIGQRYGRLLIIEPAGRSGHDRSWVCECSCGARIRALASNLRRGNTQSCGCLHSELTAAAKTKHGHAAGGEISRAYQAYRNMKARCLNPNNIAYANYGGRGIRICERWLSGFSAFLADMGPAALGLTLDRIDSNGNYEPGNCRWATTQEQNRNTRRNRWLEYRGRQIILADAVRLSGLKLGTIQARLKLGWSAEAAIHTPIRT